MFFMIEDSSSQWNGNGIHKITGTKYDELRFDIEGNNRRGFNKDGIHKITNQKKCAQTKSCNIKKDQ